MPRPFRRSVVGILATWFVRGLIVSVPITAIVAAVYWVFRELDTWINLEPLLNRRVPGAGIEELLERTPLVKLVYSSIKDLVGAFVGEKKRFNRPVLVALTPGSDVGTVGFVTRAALGEIAS